MLTTITGPEACNAVPRPAVMRSRRVVLSVGDIFALDDAVIEAYTEDERFIPSVPVDFFDNFPSNVAFERIDQPVGVAYRAKRPGLKVIKVRHYCDGSLNESLVIEIRNEGDLFIDHHGCLGEGCEYGRMYRTGSTRTVYEQSSTESAVIGDIPAGKVLLARDGEVHAVPTRFIVDREFEEFKPGDEVFALTYAGEGWWRVFHNGELTKADFGFSPYGGNTCDKPKQCWGHLEKPSQTTWWMHVIWEDSVEGWIIADDQMRAIDNKW